MPKDLGFAAVNIGEPLLGRPMTGSLLPRLFHRVFLIAIFALTLLMLSAQAAEPAPQLRPHQLVWKQWDVADGLPQITVNDLLQDDAGYLWVATQNGIARFDGVQFTSYDRADQSGPGRLMVTAVAIDVEGTIWAGSHVGISRLEGGQLVSVGADVDIGVVRQIRPLTDGSVWIATNNGLFVANGKSVTPADPHGPADAVIATIQPRAGLPVSIGVYERVIDPMGERRREPYQAGMAPLVTTATAHDGGLWLGTQAGIYRADEFGAVQGDVIAAQLSVEDLLEDPDGTLWVATDQGLWRVDASGTVEKVVVPGIDEAAWIRRLIRDREGNLWVGTQLTGLHMAWPDRFRRLDSRDGLVDGAIWSVTEGADGEVLAGAPDGLYGGGLDGFYTVMDGSQLPHPTVLASLRDEQGGLWIGTADGLVYLRPGGDKAVTVPGMPARGWIAAIQEDSNGDVLVGGLYGLFRFHDGQAKRIQLPGRSGGVGVTGLVRDRHHRWWVGYESGFALNDGVDWSVRPMPESEAQGAMLAPFGDGVLANTMSGLLYVDPDRTVVIGRSEGLHTEAVHSMVTGDSHVWLQTPNGVARLDAAELDALIAGRRSQLNVRVLGSAGASQIAECNGGQQAAALMTQGRWLWCPSLNGLLVLDTAAVDALAAPPAARVEAIVTSQRQIGQHGAASLDPNERDVEIHLTALQLREAERLTFRTRLRGYSDEWQELGNRRVAYYTNLLPGDYTFEVEATNADGVTGPVVSRAFSRQPAWHQTTLARGAALLACLLAGWGIVRVRVHGMRRQQQILEERVRLRTGQLEDANRRLAESSRTDALTGLNNRRFLLEQMPREVARATRHSMDRSEHNLLAILHVDLDHFKQINDTYGHHVGDQVLVAIGTLLTSATRDADFVARWGGEEFVIIARDVDLRGAAISAQRVVEAIRAHPFETSAGTLHVTCSVGYALHPAPGSDPGWERTLALADAATYLAKHAGRDRSVGIECVGDQSGGGFYSRLHRNPEALEREGLIRILPSGG